MTEQASFSTIEPGAMVDPYPSYDRLRAADPVHWSAPDGAWVLSRYPDIAGILADRSFRVIELARIIDQLAQLAKLELPDLHSVMEAVLFFRNPPQHGPEKRFLVSTLSVVPVSHLGPIIEDFATGLLVPLARDGRLDIATEFADRLPPMVLGRILGLDDEIVFSLIETVSDVSMAFDRGQSLRFYRRADAHVREAREIVGAEIAKRRRAPREDGLSRMIALAEESETPIDDGTMACRALFLLTVGVETTASLIGNAIKAVVETPSALAKLTADASAIPNAIEETLRFDTPIQQVTREATEDHVVGDRAIAAGDRLTLLIGAAGRDPQTYPDPHRFDVARKGPPTLAFGSDLHFCIGAGLARLEARIALAQFLRVCPQPLPDGQADRWPHRTIRRLLNYSVTSSE